VSHDKRTDHFQDMTNIRGCGREIKSVENGGIIGALVGAAGLDVTRLLALIAHTLARSLRWAIAREMADLTA